MRRGGSFKAGAEKRNKMRFVYPDGKRKALTFSYDDGQAFDKRLTSIFNEYGLKGTFHLNSGNLGVERGKDIYVRPEEVAQVYKGHEVACHGVQHRNPPVLTPAQWAAELGDDRKALEQLTGYMVQGLSYAFGNYSEEVKSTARALGIKYSRTVKSTGNFFPPADFMEWHPTCHHNERLLELGDQFLYVPGYYELPVMYVWGHSFEFGWPDDWSVIEAFARKMSGKEDIWYATNREICNYIQAVRAQEFSADTLTMHNPCAISVWVGTQNGMVEVKAGKTVYIGER